VLVDVGANRGEWSSGMAALFPKTQKLVLFEPQDECVALLKGMTLPGKVIVHGAVGEQSGAREFFVGKPGWAAASFYRRDETYFKDEEQHAIAVPVFTLDDILEKEEIEFADFAKFDIEGAELSALKGAQKTLAAGKIGAMSFEFGSGNINSRTFFRDFWELLTGHGFELFRVLPSGQVFKIREYYEDLEYFRGVSNYVAKRADSAVGERIAQ
jgi:FkbM family methyltransferase